MDLNQQPIDEYTLAAFLSGTLPEDRRREVVAYLAQNADARELLCMAHEALDAAQQPVAEPFAPPAEAPPVLRPVRPAEAHRKDRLPERSPARRSVLRVHRLRYAVAAVVTVLIVGIGLRVGFNFDTDRFRGADGQATLVLKVSTPALQFQWNEIEDAYYYRLVIYDIEQAEVVSQHETNTTHLGRNDPFVLSLAAKLKHGRTYSVLIDAIDVQNRVILSSAPQEFSLDE